MEKMSRIDYAIGEKFGNLNNNIGYGMQQYVIMRERSLMSKGGLVATRRNRHKTVVPKNSNRFNSLQCLVYLYLYIISFQYVMQIIAC